MSQSSVASKIRNFDQTNEVAEHKQAVIKGIGIGVSFLLIAGTILWHIIPAPETKTLLYWGRWLFIYAIPLFIGVLIVILKRYSSEELMKGCFSPDVGLEVEKSYLQNTVEQTLIIIPMVISYGLMAPAAMLKVIPIHATLFLIGRMLFLIGYHHSYRARLPGFVVNNYANLVLFGLCMYAFFVY